MKLLIASICLVISSVAAAQQKQILPIMCDVEENIIKFISKEYAEVPNWVGKAAEGKANASLMINSETGTWTFAIRTGGQMCLVAAGDTSTILPPVKPNKASYD